MNWRWVRPALDLMVVAAAACAFIYLKGGAVHEPDHRLTTQMGNNPTTSRSAATALSKTDLHANPLFLDSRHDTEQAMWRAWENWLKTEKPLSGNCLMEPGHMIEMETTSTHFRLLCFGNPNNRFVPVLPTSDLLFSSGIFRLPAAQSRAMKRKQVTGNQIHAPTSAEVEVAPNYAVQGWMNTREGKKHFDPSTGKWIP